MLNLKIQLILFVLLFKQIQGQDNRIIKDTFIILEANFMVIEEKRPRLEGFFFEELNLSSPLSHRNLLENRYLFRASEPQLLDKNIEKGIYYINFSKETMNQRGLYLFKENHIDFIPVTKKTRIAKFLKKDSFFV